MPGQFPTVMRPQNDAPLDVDDQGPAFYNRYYGPNAQPPQTDDPDFSSRILMDLASLPRQDMSAYLFKDSFNASTMMEQKC